MDAAWSSWRFETDRHSSSFAPSTPTRLSHSTAPRQQSLPFWSPDGRSVGFFAGQHLKRIDIDSGLVQSVAHAQPGPGGTWGPGEVILFAPVPQGPLFQVPASGGEPIAVTRLGAGQSAHWSPVFLPGSRQFLFHASGTGEASGIYLGSLDSPDTTRLTDADTPGVYAPSGWLLFGRQGALVARRFDAARRTLSGNPVTVAESVALGPVYTRAAVSVSATGTIAYRTGAANASQLTWFDRTGRAVGTLGGPGPAGPWNVALSPDGLRAAIEREGTNGTDIWIVDSRGTTPFTADTGRQRFPLWSRESTRIAYANETPNGVYQRAANGAGGAELVLAPRKIFTDWSRDGRFLLYFEVGEKTSRSLGAPAGWRQKALGFPSHRVQGTVGPVLARWSVDRVPIRRIGPVRDLHASVSWPGRQVEGLDIGRHSSPVESGWQGALLPCAGRHADGRCSSRKGAGLEPGVPVELFPTRILGGGGNLAGCRQQYTIVPDGRFFINVEMGSDPPPITLVLNWKPRE